MGGLPPRFALSRLKAGLYVGCHLSHRTFVPDITSGAPVSKWSDDGASPEVKSLSTVKQGYLDVNENNQYGKYLIGRLHVVQQSWCRRCRYSYTVVTVGRCIGQTLAVFLVWEGL